MNKIAPKNQQIEKIYRSYLCVIKQKDFKANKIKQQSKLFWQEVQRSQQTFLHIKTFDYLFNKETIIFRLSAESKTIGQILQVSQNIEQILGFNHKSLEGKSVNQLIAPFITQKHQEILNQVTKDIQYSGKVRLLFALNYQGFLQPIRVIAYLLPSTINDEGIEFISVVQVIEEQKNAGMILLNQDKNICGISQNLTTVLTTQISHQLIKEEISISCLIPELQLNFEDFFIVTETLFFVLSNETLLRQMTMFLGSASQNKDLIWKNIKLMIDRFQNKLNQNEGRKSTEPSKQKSIRSEISNQKNDKTIEIQNSSESCQTENSIREIPTILTQVIIQKKCILDLVYYTVFLHENSSLDLRSNIQKNATIHSEKNELYSKTIQATNASDVYNYQSSICNSDKSKSKKIKYYMSANQLLKVPKEIKILKGLGSLLILLFVATIITYVIIFNVLIDSSISVWDYQKAIADIMIKIRWQGKSARYLTLISEQKLESARWEIQQLSEQQFEQSQRETLYQSTIALQNIIQQNLCGTQYPKEHQNDVLETCFGSVEIPDLHDFSIKLEMDVSQAIDKLNFYCLSKYDAPLDEITQDDPAMQFIIYTAYNPLLQYFKNESFNFYNIINDKTDKADKIQMTIGVVTLTVSSFFCVLIVVFMVLTLKKIKHSELQVFQIIFNINRKMKLEMLQSFQSVDWKSEEKQSIIDSYQKVLIEQNLPATTEQLISEENALTSGRKVQQKEESTVEKSSVLSISKANYKFKEKPPKKQKEKKQKKQKDICAPLKGHFKSILSLILAFSACMVYLVVTEQTFSKFQKEIVQRIELVEYLDTLRVDVAIASGILREYVSMKGQTHMLEKKVADLAKEWNQILFDDRERVINHYDNHKNSYKNEVTQFWQNYFEENMCNFKDFQSQQETCKQLASGVMLQGADLAHVRAIEMFSECLNGNTQHLYEFEELNSWINSVDNAFATISTNETDDYEKYVKSASLHFTIWFIFAIILGLLIWFKYVNKMKERL